jgi:hypothetical protein
MLISRAADVLRIIKNIIIMKKADKKALMIYSNKYSDFNYLNDPFCGEHAFDAGV